MLRSGWNPWLGQVALAGSRRRRLGDATGLNDDTFSQATDAPASVVDFWSPSCLPCMKYKPVFEGVAAQPPGGVFMATVNADESPQTMAYYGIDSIPATLFFVSGEEVYRTQGILQRQELLDTIVKYIPSATPALTAAPSPPEQVAPASEPTRVPVKPGPVGPRPAQQAPAAASAPTTPATPKASPVAPSSAAP
jgi:thiol-disulfide isomerase/thioredoxin